MTGLNENVLNEFYCYTINYTLQGIVRVKSFKKWVSEFLLFLCRKITLNFLSDVSNRLQQIKAASTGRQSVKS